MPAALLIANFGSQLRAQNVQARARLLVELLRSDQMVVRAKSARLESNCPRPLDVAR